MRATIYRFTFWRYRRSPFESLRANFWWWLGCKIEKLEGK